MENTAGTLPVMIEWLMQQSDPLGVRHPFQDGGVILKDVAIDAFLRYIAFHHISPHVARNAITIDAKQSLGGAEVFYMLFMRMTIGLLVSRIAIVIMMTTSLCCCSMVSIMRCSRLGSSQSSLSAK